MCRLLGVVSSETTNFRFSLHEAPRSLARLSREHPDGWGLAVHGREGWRVEKHAVCAGDDARFQQHAAASQGEVLVAHIRKRTVGPICPANTHPFHRGKWVFAHNGTIDDPSFLTTRTSATRAAEVEGQTDSERYFAAILTTLDQAGKERRAIEAALLGFTRALLGHGSLGAANFLLSDGAVLYAFRLGRTLHVLDRQLGDPVRRTRTAPSTEATIETPWSPRRHAFIVASEQMTDEPFREIAEGSLVAIRGVGQPVMEVLSGSVASNVP
jgi:glutamine amidotransferase